MPKIAAFNVIGRRAVLRRNTPAQRDGYEAVRELLSYSKPGVQFYLRNHPNSTWNGKTYMVKYGAISTGLLRGAKNEIRDAGIKIKIKSWKQRPAVQLKKGFISHGAQYDYQNKCVSAMLRACKRGGGTVLSATGSGKTAMAAQFASWIDGKILFIVDQVQLLYQSQKEIAHWLKEEVGVVGNSKFIPGRVTVCTIQTLQARKRDKVFLKWMKDNDVIIIDELHKQMARRNFSIVNQLRTDVVFGLTATVEMKKKGVRWKVWEIAGPVVYEFPISEGVKSGVLSKSVVLQIAV